MATRKWNHITSTACFLVNYDFFLHEWCAFFDSLKPRLSLRFVCLQRVKLATIIYGNFVHRLCSFTERISTRGATLLFRACAVSKCNPGRRALVRAYRVRRVYDKKKRSFAPTSLNSITYTRSPIFLPFLSSLSGGNKKKIVCAGTGLI